jgi:hypothetical protein
MWDLWWTKRHWDRFFPEFFRVPLSVSFHWCSITRKRTKKMMIIIFFITGLHNKPQGCSASVASAAGPFTIKKKQSVTGNCNSPTQNYFAGNDMNVFFMKQLTVIN